MTKNNFIALLLFMVSLSAHSQKMIQDCQIKKTAKSEFMYRIDNEDVKCMIKNTGKKTLVYMFAVWCAPCIQELPKLLADFSTREDLNFILMIHSKENSTSDLSRTEAFFATNYPEVKNIYIIKDELGKGQRTKYKEFLKRAGDPEPMADLGRIVLYNKKAEVVYISNYTKSKEEIQENIQKFLKG